MKKFNVVQNWIDNVAYSHSKSEGTEYNYRHHFKLFCDFIGKEPRQILEEYKRMTDREFRIEYTRYVRAFIGYISQQEYAKGTMRHIVTSIKSFFRYNDLPLGYIAMPRYRVTYHNRDITKEEILKILEISRPRDRAFFCMMAQTGLRPETLSKLRLKNIQPDFENDIIPCKIDVPQEIAKGEYKSYFTFMGEESIKYLKIYLATRPNLDPEDYLFTSHGTEKQLGSKSMSHIFRRAIIKLRRKGFMDFEQKESGKPSTVRLYNLRKYFRKMSNQAGFEFVQFWMGHVVKVGQDEHYRPTDVEFHRQLYKEKAMPFLRLESSTPNDLEKRLTEFKDKEITELRKEVTELKGKLEFAKLVQEQIDRIDVALKKWEAERPLRQQQANQIRTFEDVMINMPDKEILDLIHETRRQLKKKQNAQET